MLRNTACESGGGFVAVSSSQGILEAVRQERNPKGWGSELFYVIIDVDRYFQ